MIRIKVSGIRWIVPIVTCAFLVGAAGFVKVIAQAPGPVFIAGDGPVTEDQVRTKLLSEGWADVRTKLEGQYIQATGTKNGEAGKVVVDARNGRLRNENEDDDDDD